MVTLLLRVHRVGFVFGAAADGAFNKQRVSERARRVKSRTMALN